MRWSVLSFISLLVVVLLIPATAPATAVEDITGVTMSMTPVEATSGMDMNMVVALHNSNNRSLMVTTLTVQIYDGPFFDPNNEYKMYHINPADGLVPANGSREFDIPGSAPSYIGMCGVLVTIGGSFEGEENISVGLLSSSIYLNPNTRGYMALGALILILPLMAVAVAVLAIMYFRKDRSSGMDIQPRCPYCGAIMPPGGNYCARCGRKR